MIHIEALGEKLMVRGNHVVIVILGKMSVQPVAGLRRFAVPDAVGKNDEVAIHIEELPRTKQFSGKDGLQELISRAARAMKNQDGVRDTALRVADRLAKRGVMQAQ